MCVGTYSSYLEKFVRNVNTKRANRAEQRYKSKKTANKRDFDARSDCVAVESRTKIIIISGFIIGSLAGTGRRPTWKIFN